jgi:hypothetical protein
VVDGARVEQPRVQLIQPCDAAHLHGGDQLLVEDCVCQWIVLVCIKPGREGGKTYSR